MAGLTPEGFTIPRLLELLTAQRQRATEIFQDLVAPGDVVDTTDSSLLGRLIALDSASDADLWEGLQDVYSSFDVNSATGIALDNLVALAGITRFENTRSTGQALFTGDNGTLIPAGSTIKAPVTGNNFTVVGSVALAPSFASGISVRIVSVSPTTEYTITYSNTTSNTTISYTSPSTTTEFEILEGLAQVINSTHFRFTATVENNELVIDFDDIFQTFTFTTSENLGITKVSKLGDYVSDTFGPVTQSVGTINTIATPVLGWDSVSNPISATPGRLIESDEDLRYRFSISKYERASNILESLYSALVNVDDVDEVVVYENDTDITDENGIPPHSFLPIVSGGITSVIGQTIWQNKPIGIRSYGNTDVTIYDSQGFAHTISFERPNPVPIYMEIVLDTNNLFPQDGVQKIKEALETYMDANFGIGADVIYSRLYTPINSIPGHQVNSLLIGKSPTDLSEANIDIAFNEINVFNYDNIEITVV